jgi:hypothetical protein
MGMGFVILYYGDGGLKLYIPKSDRSILMSSYEQICSLQVKQTTNLALLRVF